MAQRRVYDTLILHLAIRLNYSDILRSEHVKDEEGIEREGNDEQG